MISAFLEDNFVGNYSFYVIMACYIKSVYYRWNYLMVLLRL
jgi:hypothetical protein